MILLFDNLIEGRNLAALRLHQKTCAILGRKGRGRGYGNQHSPDMDIFTGVTIPFSSFCTEPGEWG